MFHASAALRGEIFQIVGKGGEPYAGGFNIFWGDLLTLLETMYSHKTSYVLYNGFSVIFVA